MRKPHYTVAPASSSKRAKRRARGRTIETKRAWFLKVLTWAVPEVLADFGVLPKAAVAQLSGMVVKENGALKALQTPNAKALADAQKYGLVIGGNNGADT